MNNKLLTERLLSLYYTCKDLRDLLTVDLFSVYLLARVDIVICYIEVEFMFGLPLYRRIRYIEARHIEVLFHTFYCNFGQDIESRSLYRGLR